MGISYGDGKMKSVLLALSLLVAQDCSAESLFQKIGKYFNSRKAELETYPTARYGHSVTVYPILTRIVFRNGDRRIDRDCYRDFPVYECVHGAYKMNDVFAINDVDKESWQYEDVLKNYLTNPGGLY